MTAIMQNLKSKLPTLVLVAVAALLALYLYGQWTQRPWTRHGQVRADIVKIAPRVAGYVVEVAVKDNQFVRKGELLFRIDPSSYQLAVDTARVQLQQAREGVAALEAAVKAAEARVMESNSAIVSARAMIQQQEAALANAKSQSARATRLANEEAGSVEAAEQRAAAFLEKKAAVESAKASWSQAKAALTFFEGRSRPGQGQPRRARRRQCAHPRSHSPTRGSPTQSELDLDVRTIRRIHHQPGRQ